MQDEVSTQVQAVLARTPLIIKPRKSLPILSALSKDIKSVDNLLSLANPTQDGSQDIETKFYEFNLKNLSVALDKKANFKLDIVNTMDVNASTSGQSELSECNKPPAIIKVEESDGDLLNFASPVEQSDVDGAVRNTSSLSNINYDIDFSDMSAENSTADDLTPNRRQFMEDPFSPTVLSDDAHPVMFPTVDALEFVLPLNQTKENEVDDEKNEAVVTETKPVVPSEPAPGYSGFAKQGFQIPSIPCSTGHANLHIAEEEL